MTARMPPEVRPSRRGGAITPSGVKAGERERNVAPRPTPKTERIALRRIERKGARGARPDEHSKHVGNTQFTHTKRNPARHRIASQCATVAIYAQRETGSKRTTVGV